MKKLYIFTDYPHNSIDLFIKECNDNNLSDKEAYLVNDSSITKPTSINDFIDAALFYFESNEYSHVKAVYIITNKSFDTSNITKGLANINIDVVSN